MYVFSVYVCTHVLSLTSKGQISLQYDTEKEPHSEMYGIILEAYLLIPDSPHIYASYLVTWQEYILREISLGDLITVRVSLLGTTNVCHDFVNLCFKGFVAIGFLPGRAD